MMRRLLLVLALASCTKATPQNTPPAPPAPAVAPPSTPAPVAKAATVTLTAVTLADDCGGSPPWGPPSADKGAKKVDAAVTDKELYADMDTSKAKMKRRCEQTSMQLSITAG